jgi:hypothetical protein
MGKWREKEVKTISSMFIEFILNSRNTGEKYIGEDRSQQLCKTFQAEVHPE